MRASVPIILFILLLACENEHKQVLERFPNGAPLVEKIFPSKSDSSTYKIIVYHDNGKKYQEATVEKGLYVGKKITYYHTGTISQIDSLSHPCDTTIDLCNGATIRYYENGKISQRYTVSNNEHNGMSQHFAMDGKIVKEYVLLHDTIKNGLYREFHDNGKVSYSTNYENDTITGFAYYFDEKGDTVKYHSHYMGVLDFPYQKWLDNGQIIRGIYSDKSEQAVIWIWYDKDRRELKRKTVKPTKEGYAAPE